MAKNSLFAILLRSPWWISLALGLAIGLVAMALLPADLRVVGAVSGLPFLVIAAMAAWRQWQLPSAKRIDDTVQAVSVMAWPAFAALLEQAFQRDGYQVQRGRTPAVDFELERGGRRLLVSARRWKSAHTGLEALKPLQVARDAGEGAHALYIGLGTLTDTARVFAADHAITVWQAAELAQALRRLPLVAPAAAKGGAR
jgi:restriction system protein